MEYPPCSRITRPVGSADLTLVDEQLIVAGFLIVLDLGWSPCRGRGQGVLERHTY